MKRILSQAAWLFFLLFLFHSSRAQIIDSFPMPAVKFDPRGELIITASPSSSNKDFDFLVGNWLMKNKHLNAKLANCKEYTEFESTVENHAGLQGMGNFDVVRRKLDNGTVYEGRTVRTFDPQTRLWRLYWMDSNGGPLDPPRSAPSRTASACSSPKTTRWGGPSSSCLNGISATRSIPGGPRLSPTTMGRHGSGTIPILPIG